MKNVLWRRVVILIASAITSALVFVAVALYFVTTRTGQLLDQRAFDGASLGQRTVAPFTLSLLDAIPVIGVAIALTVAIFLTVIRRNVFVLVVAVCAAVAANVATQVMKNVLLERPDLGVDGYALNSLPSGHTTLAASSALVVFLVSSPRSRPMVGAIGALFTTVVGVSTLANQWHRPSDVVAALVLVAFFGSLAGLVVIRSRFTAVVPQRDVWSRMLLLVVLPCAGLAAATFFVSIFEPLAYIGAAAAIAACVFFMTAAGNHVFRTIL